MTMPLVTLHSVRDLITVRHGDMEVMGTAQQLADFVEAINAGLRRAERAAVQREPLPVVQAPVDWIDV